MKKVFKIGLIGAVVAVSLLLGSCANYIDQLSIAGYKYTLTEVVDGESDEPVIDTDLNDYSSIEFGKDGSSITWTVDGKSHTGTYAVNQSDENIVFDVTGSLFNDSYTFTYSDYGETLTIELDSFGEDYPKNGDYKYTITYTLD